MLGVELRRVSGGVIVGRVVAHPAWADRDAGWVVRDVAAARLDPQLVARVGAALDASWNRTAAVVGPFLPAG